MKKEFLRQYYSGFIILILLLIFSVVSLFVGVLDIKTEDILREENTRIIFFAARLPRLGAILCTGAGMSIAGLIMQKLCRNKFVSPTTGATISSAQFGILVATLAIPSASLLFRAFFSFAFALAGTWIFALFIERIQHQNAAMVALIGIMFGNIITGITNFFAYKYALTQQLNSWVTGSFSTILAGRYELVYMVLPLIVVAFVFADYFNIVGMGRDFSGNLGMNYDFMLFLGITICAMITAAVVVVVGQISYIGLIIPNIVVMFRGDRLRGTLVMTGLLGALYILLCDMLARLLIKPYELPVELISGIFGSVVFVGVILYTLKFGSRSVVSVLKKGRRGGGESYETGQN